MPDNRPPRPPDDDLPDWLSDKPPSDEDSTDILPKAKPPASAASGVTGSLPWMSDTGKSDPSAPNEPSFDWTTSGTGGNADDLGAPDFDDLDWLTDNTATPETGNARPGLTGSLPWREGVSDPADRPTDHAEIPPPTDVSWLDDTAIGDPTSPIPPPVTPPPSAPRGLKRLVTPNQPPPTATPLPAEPPRPSLRKLSPSAPLPPTPAPPPASPAPDIPSDMTFEDWERAQIDKEQAATRDPDESLLDAVPDWFANVAPDAGDSSSTAAPPANPNAPEFVPDWFAGQEEGSADAAPDWFNPAELGSTTLAGPDSFAAPPVLPPPTPPGTELAAMPADDLPDWMADLERPAQPVSTPNRDLDALFGGAPDSPSPAAESADLPDWLSAPADSSALPAADLPSAGDELPDWMRDMAPAERTPMAAAPNESVVDWFGESGTLETTDQSGGEDETIAPAGDLPDWLSAVDPNTVSSAHKPSTGAIKLDLSKNVSSDDIDALLSLPMPESSSVMVPDANIESLETASGFDDSYLDDILGEQTSPPPPDRSEVAPSAASAPLGTPPKKQTGTLRKLPPQSPSSGVIDMTGAVPEQVRDLYAGPVEMSIGATSVTINESPLAELTDQLRQLRDRSRKVSPAAAEAAPATSGPLADLPGVLAAEPSVAQSAARPAAPVQAIMSDLQARRIRLIEKMLEIEVAPETATETDATAAKAVAAKPRARIRIKLDRLVITAILALALITPFLTDAVNLVAPPDTSAATAAQTAVFGAIDKIHGGQPVLVAFEYGPTGSGELDDMARVLLIDLFKHGAKPVIVSTNPAGALHAEALLSVLGHDTATLSVLGRTDQPLQARTDYVVLRYLPAGAAGVRTAYNAIHAGGFAAQSTFVTDLEGQPSGLTLDRDVPGLANAPAIVLAESPEDVRNWAEQYRTIYQVPAGDLLPCCVSAPGLILIASAAAEATARTYSAALPNNVTGPLIGLRDATIYRALRQPPAKASAAKALDQRWQSVGLGALVAGLIIFLGSMFSLIGAVRRRGVSR